MPELPEVETICKGLSQKITNNVITEIYTRRNKLRIDIPDDIDISLQNRKIKQIVRRAKYILIYLDNDKILIIHLGMSGKLTVVEANDNFQKHDHVIFTLDDNRQLRYNDQRRFGLITTCDKDQLSKHKLFANLGLEPLEDEFNPDSLFNILKSKNTNIKNVIMNANLIVGVGNIYASESLFKAKILPTRIANKVSKKEASLLCEKIKETLKEAIAAGGSSLKDYVDSNGNSGYFQFNFKVYARDGEECINCKNEIIKIKQNGRSSFYCKNCQT